MRCCSVVICIKASSDIMAAAICGYLLQRILSTGDMVLIIFNHECESHLFCFSIHILFISFIQFSLVWMVVSYLFRYYILHYRNPSINKVVFVAVSCYLPLLIHSFVWINMYAENEVTRTTRMFSKPKETVLTGWVVQDSSFVIIGILGLISVMVFIFYLIIHYSLVMFFKKNCSRISKNTFIFHGKLLQTVNFHSSIPICIFLGILIYFSMHFSLLNPICVQHFPILFFVVTTVISPMSYFYSLPSQWNFCYGVPKKFRKKPRTENSPSGTLQTVTFAVSVF